MPSSRRRASRLSGFVLALVLLIPLSLSGHHHRADDATAKQSCVVCMVTSACPAAQTTAGLTLAAPAAAGILAAPATALVGSATYRPFKAGRAPPLRFAPRPA